MDLLIRVHVESPLDEGKGHLQGLHPQLGAVLGDELQPLNAHQPAVAGGVLLQILATSRGELHQTGKPNSLGKKNLRFECKSVPVSGSPQCSWSQEHSAGPLEGRHRSAWVQQSPERHKEADSAKTLSKIIINNKHAK